MSLHYGFLSLSLVSRRESKCDSACERESVIAVSRLYGLVDENVATRNFFFFYVSIVTTHHTDSILCINIYTYMCCRPTTSLH